MPAKKTTAEKAAKLTGKELIRAAVNQILDHPETWDQRSWHCGTKHCIAGWCQILSGQQEDESTCLLDAQAALGISRLEAEWLFSGARSLPEIHGFATLLISDEKFDRDGFNRAGFDRDGFDRSGFDRAGFDRAGFDRAGFDRAGFNRDGFDRDGFNRDGFDRAGFDRDGFNRDGFNRAGKTLPRL